MAAQSPLPMQENTRFSVLPPPVRVEDLTFSATGDIDAMQREWRGFETRAVGHVFQSWAWVSNWHSHVGRARGIDAFVITASDRSGRLRAILPFGIESRMGARWLVWLGGEHADYKGPLIDRELLASLDPVAARNLFDAAIALVPGIDVIALEEMPETLGDVPNPMRTYEHQLSPIAAHQLTLGTDFDTFYKDRRSSASRKKLRQKARRLEEAAGGEVAMRHAYTRTERAAAIAALIEQKRTRLAERGVGDMFAEPGVRAFYRALADLHPELCQLTTFESGDTIVAANWGLHWGDRYYYVLSTMADGPLRDHSPGALHLNELIQWAISRGLRTFDFTAGDESYKDDWCDSHTRLFDVYRGLTTRGRILAGVRSATRAAKREIKHSPRLWQQASAVRKALYKARQLTGW